MRRCIESELRDKMAEHSTEEMEVSCIVDDYISYQLQMNGYEWRSPTATPTKVNSSLRSLGNEFKTRYRDSFLEMTESLDIQPSTAHATFLGVANELFSEGVTWARIVALFVFGSEMALICQRMSHTEIVSDVAEWLSSYIKANLLTWIRDHDGWDGLVTFHEGYDDLRSESPWPVLKKFVCGVAAGVIGALTVGAILSSKS